MTTKSTDLINIENCILNNDIMGAINIWMVSYNIITPSEFLNCCINTGKFFTAKELIDVIDDMALACNIARQELRKINH